MSIQLTSSTTFSKFAGADIEALPTEPLEPPCRYAFC